MKIEVKKQNPLTAAGLILVIVIALMLVIKVAMPRRPLAIQFDSTCEACGYKFTSFTTAGVIEWPIECRKCGKAEVVRNVYYDCEECGDAFETYRTKMMPRAGAAPGSDGWSPLDMEGFLREPDGQWLNERSEEAGRIMKELSCPECRNTVGKAR